MKQGTGDRVQWLGPIAALLVVGVAAAVLRKEIAEFHVGAVLEYLGAIPRTAVVSALVLTFVSYWWLAFYDVLAQRYMRKVMPYGRTVLAAFVAYAFGHNMALAGFTAAAVRLRLYGATGLSALEIATLSGFCSVTSMLGLALLASSSLLFEPRQIADLADAALVQVALGHLADAGHLAYIQAREETCFAAGRNPQDSVRLGLIRGDLRNHA
mgnify:CR=1 FL=1